MRSVSSGELTLLTAAHSIVHYWVSVENGAGTFVDLTNLGASLDFVLGLEWGGDIDDPVVSGSVTLATEVTSGGTTYSLAPFISGSPLNTDGVGYAPLLLGGRRLKVWTALVAPGTSKASALAVRRPVVDGKVDDVSDSNGQIVVTFRDVGAYLLHTQLEAAATYGSEEGVDLADVIQQQLDAWPGRLGSPTLVVDDPGGALNWALQAYEQARGGNVLLAVRDLALQIGWDVRYRWSAADAFQLTLADPGRAKTVADFTLTAGQYYYRPSLAVSDRDVYNVLRVWYRDAATGLVTAAEGVNADSVLAFGRRYGEFDATATRNVDATRAQDMADRAVSDIGDLYADFGLETRYYWPVDVFDLGSFPANALTHDDPQTFAVVRYRHTITATERRTTMLCRGHVAGAYQNWLDRLGQGLAAVIVGIPQPVIHFVVAEATADGGLNVGGKVWVRITFDRFTERVDFYATTGPEPGLPAPSMENADFARSLMRPEGTTGEFAQWGTFVDFACHAGFYYKLTIRPYGADNVPGPPLTLERQAIDSGVAVLAAVSDVLVTRVGGVNRVTWTSASGNTAPAGFGIVTCVARDGLVIAALAYAAGARVFDDGGLRAESTYDYQVFELAHDGALGLADAKFAHSGPRVSSLTGPQTGDGVPVFTDDTPKFEPSDLTIEVSWAVDDPDADELQVWRQVTGAFGQPGLVTWVRAHTATGGAVAAGTVFLPGGFTTASIPFQLRTFDADGTALKVSDIGVYPGVVITVP